MTVGIENFIHFNRVQPWMANELRYEDEYVQAGVLAVGPLTGDRPTAILRSRP